MKTLTLDFRCERCRSRSIFNAVKKSKLKKIFGKSIFIRKNRSTPFDVEPISFLFESEKAQARIVPARIVPAKTMPSLGRCAISVPTFEEQ